MGRRWPTIALGLAVAATGLTASALPAGGEPAPEARSSATRGPVVGRVTGASAAQLWVKRARGGGVVALARGDLVHLGDVVAAGPGARAEIELRIPRGAGEDDTLLHLHKRLSPGRPSATSVVPEIGVLVPIVRTKPTLRLSRTGELIEATLRP